MAVLYDADLTLQVHVRNAHAGSDKHQDIDSEVKREVKKIMEKHSNPNFQMTYYPKDFSIYNIRNTEKTEGDILADEANSDYQDSLSHTTDVHGTKPEYPPHKKEEEKAGPKESAENLSKYTK